MGNAVNKRVVVIGAGIVGASLAYHLAGKGAKVILVEAEDIASGVTGRSFAWINTSHSGPDPIASLRGAAIQEYRRLETELPGLKVRWTGALSYGASPGEAQQASGNPPSATRVSRSQILDLEPNLKHPRSRPGMPPKKARWTPCKPPMRCSPVPRLMARRCSPRLGCSALPPRAHR